jgi:hypothetical protein
VHPGRERSLILRALPGPPMFDTVRVR